MAYRRTAEVQARLDAQRDRIVAAATELIAENGYAACSINAVAVRAGVAAGTVYNHVAGKPELMAEVFRHVVTREVAAVAVAVDQATGTADRIAALIETFAGRALKAPRLAYALLVEPVDPGVDLLRLRFRTEFRDILAATVTDGIRAGELPGQDAVVVASALVGAIGEALVGPLSSSEHGGSPAAVPALITFALRSLGVHDAAHA